MSLFQDFPYGQWLRITCQRRGHGFNPWSGKILEAQGLCSATKEASAMSSRYTTTREKPPLSTPRESLGIATETQGSQKNKYIKKLKYYFFYYDHIVECRHDQKTKLGDEGRRKVGYYRSGILG